MALVFALKYKHPHRVLAVLDEETPIVIEQNHDEKKIHYHLKNGGEEK